MASRRQGTASFLAPPRGQRSEVGWTFAFSCSLFASSVFAFLPDQGRTPSLLLPLLLQQAGPPPSTLSGLLPRPCVSTNNYSPSNSLCNVNKPLLSLLFPCF